MPVAHGRPGHLLPSDTDGYPQNFAVPANFVPLRAQERYIPKDNATAYIQSWHFTVQRSLAKDLLLDVAYVGNKGQHVMILGDFNQARPNNPNENLSLQARRPVPNFTELSKLSLVEIFGGRSAAAAFAGGRQRSASRLPALPHASWYGLSIQIIF